MTCVAWAARALALGCLSGCASGTCTDPARAGFFDGIGNVASGCYDRQEQALTAEASMAAARRDSLRADATALEDQARSLSRERQALVLRVAAAQRELAQTSERIDALARAKKVQGNELSGLRRREAGLTSELHATGQSRASTSDAEITRMVADNQALAAQVNALSRRLGAAQ